MKATSALAVVGAASLLSSCDEPSAGPAEGKQGSTAAETQRRAMPAPAEAAAPRRIVPLDDLFSFTDAYSCRPSDEFRALLDGLIHWEEARETHRGVLRAPPVPARFREQVGAPRLAVDGNEYRATVPLRGTWQGLALQSVVLVAWVESESGFSLQFDATPEQVLDAANRAGFRLPPSGSEYRDGEVLGVNVGVEEREGGAALYCVEG